MCFVQGLGRSFARVDDVVYPPWIDCAIPRLRINFGIYVFVCRKCGISVRSRVCAGQIIPAFSAVKRMRKLHYLVGLLTCCGCRRASWHQLVRRRSLGTLDVQLYTACFVRCSLDSRENARVVVLSAEDISSRVEEMLCDRVFSGDYSFVRRG